tara:strand:+ start:1048 stop:1212 length:165 start_codon:yes stop_codon:yes gene_type:complete
MESYSQAFLITFLHKGSGNGIVVMKNKIALKTGAYESFFVPQTGDILVGSGQVL